MRVKELIEILNQMPPDTLVSTLERKIIQQNNEDHLLLEDRHNTAVITLENLEKDIVYVSEVSQWKRENRIPVTIRDIEIYIRFLKDILQEVERIRADGELTAEAGYDPDTDLTLQNI